MCMCMCWLVWPVSARVGLVLACVALMLVAWEAPTGAACCALVLACVASAGLRWPDVSMRGFCMLACVAACWPVPPLSAACVACAGMCLRCLRLVLAGADLCCGLCWPVCLCGLCWPVCLCGLCWQVCLCGLCWQVCLCGLRWPVPPVSAACAGLMSACAACAGLCDWCWPDVSARGLPGLCAHAGDDPADDQAPTISQPLRAVSQ